MLTNTHSARKYAVQDLTSAPPEKARMTQEEYIEGVFVKGTLTFFFCRYILYAYKFADRRLWPLI
jgi:hypothetical protein